MAESADEVRAAIAQDREQLAETVQALADKADVKARVKEKTTENAEQLKQKATEVVEKVRQITPQQAQSAVTSAADKVQERPFPFAVAAAFAVGLLIGRLLGSRR